MKKILTLVAAVLCFSTVLNAQDGAEAKRFRFGIRLSPTPYWLRSNDLKNYTSNGTRFGFGVGLQMEFKLTENVSFCTGLGGDFEGGKQKYVNPTSLTTNVMLDPSQNPIDNSGLGSISGSGNQGYQVNARSIKSTYVTIPITLKMMTNEISGLKYYVVFGGNIGILAKAKATDDLQKWSGQYDPSAPISSTTTTVQDINIYSDCIPVKVGLNAGAGAEYRMAGNTSLFVTLTYLRAFTNMYKSESNILFQESPSKYYYPGSAAAVIPGNGTMAKSKQGAFGDGFQINFGVLF